MNAINSGTRLRLEFQKELQGYYQMHGEKNGCPIEGTIYPPDIKPNDEVALQFLERFASAGGRHVDTARIYAAGETEPMLGRALRSCRLLPRWTTSIPLLLPSPGRRVR